MNFFSKLSVVGLIMASSTAFAVEPAMGWYAGLFAGPSYAPETDFRFTQNAAAIPFNVGTTPYNLVVRTPASGASITYGVFVNGGLQLGYRCNKFRYEGELLVDSNSISKLRYNSLIVSELYTGNFPSIPYTLVETDISNPNFTLTNKTARNDFFIRGNTTLTGAFFNAYYEFYDQDYSYTRIVPYVGLGIGYASINNMLSLYYNTYLYNPTTGGFYSRDILLARTSNSTSTPMGQGIIGLNYFFSDTMSIGTDFRYISTNKIKSIDSKYQTYTWNFLINYTFDQPIF